jgi:transposase
MDCNPLREARQLRREIAQFVETVAPSLLTEPESVRSALPASSSLGRTIGRFRLEGAFAMRAARKPNPRGPRPTHCYRLSRGGDRQLNQALHTIALTRRAAHPPTRAYIDHRTPGRQTTPENQPLSKARPGRPPPPPTRTLGKARQP